MGYFGCNSFTKFIPENYKNASRETRIKLLSGLVSSDGDITTDAVISYTTVSEKLINDIIYLVRSLGGICTKRSRYTNYTSNGEKKIGAKSYRINILIPNSVKKEILFLERHKERINNSRTKTNMLTIKSIEKIGKYKAQCIMVDHPSHLYITDDFIVTHNTALLETLLLNISKLNNTAVALFEIEMSEEQIGLRAIAGHANINVRQIKSGRINPVDSKETHFRMSETMVELSSLKFYLDDKTSKIQKIAARIRYMARCLGVKVFGIDHLSIVDNSNNKKPRHEQMAEVIEILRALKKELSVTIILLAQLVRGAEGEKPTLSDLRETGVAEQSAEDVWMLYRDRQANIEQKMIPTKLMIMKQREGPCGDIDLMFNTEIVKYFESEV